VEDKNRDWQQNIRRAAILIAWQFVQTGLISAYHKLCWTENRSYVTSHDTTVDRSLAWWNTASTNNGFVNLTVWESSVLCQMCAMHYCFPWSLPCDAVRRFSLLTR